MKMDIMIVNTSKIIEVMSSKLLATSKSIANNKLTTTKNFIPGKAEMQKQQYNSLSGWLTYKTYSCETEIWAYP